MPLCPLDLAPSRFHKLLPRGFWETFVLRVRVRKGRRREAAARGGRRESIIHLKWFSAGSVCTSLTSPQQNTAWGRVAGGLALPLLLPNVDVTFYLWLRQLIRWWKTTEDSRHNTHCNILINFSFPLFQTNTCLQGPVLFFHLLAQEPWVRRWW